MREYGKVSCDFWALADRDGMTDHGKLLALYLQTCVHSTIAGVFRLPDGYAAEDLRWQPERVREGFRELLANGFANRCETTKWVWVVKHLDWNPPENPNQLKAVLKVVATVPAQCAWRPEFMRVCGPRLGIEDRASGNGSETVREPIANQEQEQEQEQKAARKRAQSGFDASKIELPNWLPRDSWEAWVADRKERRKPVSERAAQEQIAELAAYRKEGHDPAEVIRHSIASGWQGLYPKRQQAGQRRSVSDSDNKFEGAL